MKKFNVLEQNIQFKIKHPTLTSNQHLQGEVGLVYQPGDRQIWKVNEPKVIGQLTAGDRKALEQRKKTGSLTRVVTTTHEPVETHEAILEIQKELGTHEAATFLDRT